MITPGSRQQRTGIPPEILAAVRRIEIRTRRLVEEVFSGEYQSVFKGTGMEFREVREYVPGDDIRTIDWNVTARTGAPFVKLYEEERELTMVLAVDMSRSGWFGSGGALKVEVAAELCGVLAFAAIANKDKVGLILFSDRVEKFIPPGKGKSHVLRLIRELLTFRPRGTGTDLNAPLRQLGALFKRRATVFLVSDFWSGEFDVNLGVAARRHDLVAVRVRDPRESALPQVGLVAWRDAESGQEILVDSSDPRLSAALQGRVRERDERLEHQLSSLGVDLMDVDASCSYVTPLREFFLRREGRRRRASR